jgi:predicted deacylase
MTTPEDENRPDDTALRPPPSMRRPGLWGVAAVAVWLVLVPSACLLLVGLLAGQAARSADLATRAARSAAELATVSTYLQGSAVAATGTAQLVDLPATWAAGTSLAITPAFAATHTATHTATPAASATATATAMPIYTRTAADTATLTATVTATATGELVIGQSVAGRPITVTQFGSGPSVRLIVAGIHGGNELNTTQLADQLIVHLRNAPEQVPGDVTLYVLRSLNPDGAARGTDIYARANDHNVDLNRNWPARWQADWSRNGCWKYLNLSGGTSAGSEPEVQSLMGFMLDHQVEAVISYHSAALGIFAGGQPPDPASLSLAEAVAAVSDYPYPALDFGCVYTGQLIDWASEQGIAALDVELTNHTDTDLAQNLDILNVLLAWHR